ncbi:MAG: hypothetical protein WCT03_21870 [Candidatus Obscuribacterales bacterium]
MPHLNSQNNPSLYVWEPGAGPSAEALARLVKVAPRPSVPPGVAWMMSPQRRMYTEFLDQPGSTIPSSALRHFLFEATTGVVSFHDVPEEVERWRSWYRHLLPFLVARADEMYAFHFLLEPVLTAFFRFYCLGFNEEYEGFRRDVLESLGQAVMMPSLWDENGESICAKYQDWETYGSLWPSCSGAISASLFFCLTYLEKDEIAAWTESVFAINSAHFQAHVLSWLAGSLEILSSNTPHIRAIKQAPIEIKWQESWLLEKMTPPLPKANIHEFLTTVRRVVTLDSLYAWLDNISRISELSEPLAAARIAEIVADLLLVGEK